MNIFKQNTDVCVYINTTKHTYLYINIYRQTHQTGTCVHCTRKSVLALFYLNALYESISIHVNPFLISMNHQFHIQPDAEISNTANTSQHKSASGFYCKPSRHIVHDRM